MALMMMSVVMTFWKSGFSANMASFRRKSSCVASRIVLSSLG
jgi:hypothetical protein